MNRNVLEYLEKSAELFPKKKAVLDLTEEYNYYQLYEKAKAVGSGLVKITQKNAPVVIYMEKGVYTLCAFLGTAYAGGFYSLINPEFPQTRINDIQKVLQSKIVITDKSHFEQAEELFSDIKILLIEDLLGCRVDDGALLAVRDKFIDTDPLYVNFTSGSTGKPKGIVVSHRSVVDFIDCFTELFEINNTDIIANQAPFDFDVSVKDIYSSLKVGASLIIVPKEYFSAPVKLIDFLCENKITTMIWAVSALCLITTFHGLEYKTPDTVKKILFSGEVMPLKHLKIWQKYLPQTMFVNLYGPTEITCNCTYHILNPNREYEDGIPIGKHFPNEDVFLLNEDNKIIVGEDLTGEICVRGTALALGYFSMEKETQKAFVNNPLNNFYPETIYRTGDLAKYNQDGDLIFCGRKDFQIKYKGHRIELEEIERAMSKINGINRCCCIFDNQKEKLYGFYIGDVEKKDLLLQLQKLIPSFMVPSAIRKVDNMPLTKNGKIDRKALYASERK